VYADLPLPKSPFGEQMYGAGRQLVEVHGLALDTVVWDADEVLWDWAMSVGHMMRGMARLVLRDYSHREFFRVKPGILELLWGMHKASRDAGLDAGIRLWTDGYPWRLWQIARRIPGFPTLLGLEGAEGAEGADGHAAIARHPNVFSRLDYAAALEVAVDWYRHDSALPALAEPLRSLVRTRLRTRRLGPTWKLPELAQWIGKTAFARAAVLVDDQHRNVEAFAATGRRAVQVVNATPRVLFGRVPNSVWARPDVMLESLATRIAAPLAAALATARHLPAGRIVVVRCAERAPEHTPIAFAFDVPDARIRAEWLDPLRRVRARLAR
jgi:hypothetical protein